LGRLAELDHDGFSIADPAGTSCEFESIGCSAGRLIWNTWLPKP
jgi:hypothetical protein